MKKINLEANATIFDDINELLEGDRVLMDKAIEATKTSYSPYSQFRVGACVLLEGGIYVAGSNQENAAYPSGMCAERVAIWKAATSYPKTKILKIAITAITDNKKIDKPVGPCGACRQSMLEYELDQEDRIEVIFMGETGKVVKVESVVSLLPFSFDHTYL